jgi:putative DNA primase/helicase
MDESLKERAKGRWRGILLGAGVGPDYLTGKQSPCPMCGGKDRFHFSDYQGRGGWYCNPCGGGDGFKLLMLLHGVDFAGACRIVEREIGAAPLALPKPDDDRGRRQRLKAIWARGKPLDGQDTASRYLEARKIRRLPAANSVRFLSNLDYWDGKLRLFFPAMVARVVAPDDSAATLHRTYLVEPGVKAPVDKCKLLMPGRVPAGGAVRLAPCEDVLGIAEGIETALSASELSGLPVWACLTAGALVKWTPPPGVRRIVIFGDADASFCGQNVAYGLAYKLTTMYKALKVEVEFPPIGFKDYNEFALRS